MLCEQFIIYLYFQSMIRSKSSHENLFSACQRDAESLSRKSFYLEICFFAPLLDLPDITNYSEAMEMVSFYFWHEKVENQVSHVSLWTWTIVLIEMQCFFLGNVNFLSHLWVHRERKEERKNREKGRIHLHLSFSQSDSWITSISLLHSILYQSL